MDDQIAKLEARMAAAAEAGEFEEAAQLRDALSRLRSGESRLRAQRPGAMGLGSSQEDYVRDPATPLPKRPDPITAGHSRGGRRRR